MTAYDEQIRESSNGWVITAVLRKTRTKRNGLRVEDVWTWSHGPFESQYEAKKGSARLRNTFKRTDIELVTITVRPLWKTDEIKEATRS